MKSIYLKNFYSKPKYIKKKNGYILCAIDGSKIEIPNTPLNKETFGSEGNQHKQKTASHYYLVFMMWKITFFRCRNR